MLKKMMQHLENGETIFATNFKKEKVLITGFRKEGDLTLLKLEFSNATFEHGWSPETIEALDQVFHSSSDARLKVFGSKKAPVQSSDLEWEKKNTERLLVRNAQEMEALKKRLEVLRNFGKKK